MRINMKFLVAGQLSMILGIACSMLNGNHFINFQIWDFLWGLFIGLSMVMNLTFLVRYSHVSKCRFRQGEISD